MKIRTFIFLGQLTSAESLIPLLNQQSDIYVTGEHAKLDTSVEEAQRA
jgi:hypothetical protein